MRLSFYNLLLSPLLEADHMIGFFSSLFIADVRKNSNAA